MKIAKLLPFNSVEYLTVLFYRYLNYFASCFLIDLNGIIPNAISQRKRLESSTSSVFKFQSDSLAETRHYCYDFCCYHVSFFSCLSFLFFFFFLVFSFSPFIVSNHFSLIAGFSNLFQFQDPILCDKQVNLQPLSRCESSYREANVTFERV